jgi:glycolate dehydrogenase FAD-linked subunit
MDIIELLRREFNPSQVIVDENSLVNYSVDESGQGPYFPQAAFIALSPLEVELLLKLSLEYGFPITPRGLGTGKSGGSLPLHGGVVLAMDRMNKILEIDRESLLAVVEPGVVTETFQNAVWEQNLFYPPDPASLDSCSMGGNVAENAGGPRAFRYGVTREYLLGMEVVTMGGRRFNAGKKSVKGVSGFDLAGLLTGSEGTLGVFTKLIMKLIPQHLESGIVMAYFKDLTSAGNAVTSLLSSSVFPMSIEIMDKVAMDHIRGIEGFSPPDIAGGAVLCELEGLPEDDNLLEKIADIFEKENPLHIDVAMDRAGCRRIWLARRDISTQLKEKNRFKVSEDIAVPRGAIIQMLHRVEEIAKKYGLEKACYGHAGDGNLHVNFISNEDDPHANFELAIRELFFTAISLGGTLSGEHGIGISKKRFMPIEHDPFALSIMKSIKKAWDPWNLLNPGKIFPD